MSSEGDTHGTGARKGACPPDPWPALKAELRSRVRAARAGLTPEERERAAEAVAERAAALPETRAPRAVLGYHALEEELDPAPLLELVRSRGARIALPRTGVEGRLTLHWADDPAELERGALGIMEPPADAPGPTLGDLDLLIVPGIAFDEGCRRLGFGGGFYDRLLGELAPGTAAIGLAYDAQIVEEVPSQDHDRAVHLVVTPSGVYRARV